LGDETWDQRAGGSWSLWDLWFSVVAVLDHDGDLDALAAGLTEPTEYRAKQAAIIIGDRLPGRGAML